MDKRVLRHKFLGIYSFFFAMMILGWFFLAPSTSSAASLGNETSLGVSGEHLDMEIEADGDLHLVYNKGYAVYYLRQVNGVWKNELLVPGSDSSYTLRWYPRLAVDSQGNAHIAWASINMTATYYNSFTNGSWTGREKAISDSYTGCGYGDGPDTNRCDIAVDKNDNVIVVAQSDWAINYNKRTPSGGFQGEGTLPGSYFCGSEPKNPTIRGSLTTDSVLAIYAKNNAAPTQGLMANFMSGGSWGSPFRPGGSGGYCCVNNSSIGFDQNGKPHLAWIAWTNGGNFSDMAYMYQKPDGSWSSYTTLISGNNYFTCPSDECSIPQVRVADDGTVLIAFADGSYNYSNSNVMYFIKEPGLGWDGPNLITTGSNFQNYPALAVQGNMFYVAWSDGRGTMYMRTIQVGEPLLNPPQLYEASLSGNQVTLHWNPPNPNTILDHYLVQRRTRLTGFVTLAQTSGTSYVDTLSQTGYTYTYRIVAVDIYNRESPPSNEMSVVFDVPAISALAFLIILLTISLLLIARQTVKVGR